MKMITKLILIGLISILLIFNQPLYSRATSLDDVISAGNDFLNIEDTGGDAVPNTIDDTELQGLSNTVSNVLLTIALIVTLISAIVMGINFAIQSVEDKAKIKESMIPWVIGIFVSFGAYGIWRITMGVFYDLL